ncbi:MAG: RhuM family protein [bacterium]
MNNTIIKNPVDNSENKGEIVIYRDKDKNIILEADLRKDTIWLTQAQIAYLFDSERSVITKHLDNVFKSGELGEKSNVQKKHIGGSDKPVKTYSLDAILSVGYRVNSKKATQFRIWATNTLRNYIVKGYALNRKQLLNAKEKQLADLEQAVKLIAKIVKMRQLTEPEGNGLLKVITEYAKSWILIQKYDNRELKLSGRIERKESIFDYDFAKMAIGELKNDLINRKEASNLFGSERENGFKKIMDILTGSLKENIIEEKAANLLYLIVKNRPFIDGNRRIASFLFILYLVKNGILFKANGEKKINDDMLVALTLLTAESDPAQKDIIIKLIVNFINS